VIEVLAWASDEHLLSAGCGYIRYPQHQWTNRIPTMPIMEMTGSNGPWLLVDHWEGGSIATFSSICAAEIAGFDRDGDCTVDDYYPVASVLVDQTVVVDHIEDCLGCCCYDYGCGYGCFYSSYHWAMLAVQLVGFSLERKYNFYHVNCSFYQVMKLLE